jgi:ABC-2 type transport system ATP-binding protein
MSIIVKDLVKLYGEQKAVNGISFSVNKGEIVGFLGPNGAGKSTTMKMITGYLPPDAGSISVSGINVLDQPLEAKKKIGYLPESNALYYDMYIREYLDFVAGINNVTHKKEAINQAIQLTGLKPESRKKIGQLSKGYKQRVGLAAALLHQPEVLVLDEPTSGLDPNQIVEIRQVIKEQGKDKLVLFSSHILQEVEAICDRVIIINKGRIVADDTVNNLRKSAVEKTTIVLELKEEVATEVMKETFGDGIQKLSNAAWRLETAEPEALKKRILEFTLQKNLNIVSLQSEKADLEEVFRSLTNNAPAVPLSSF